MMRRYYYSFFIMACAHMLMALGPADDLVAMIKSHNNQDNIITFVINHPETINSYVSGYTPLMHAIFEQLDDVAQRLITQKADIHLKDQNALGNALMYAVSYDLPDTVQTLINYGARLDNTDVSGRTVWDYLKRSENMNNPYAPKIRVMLEQYARRIPERATIKT